jgi:hypothetical protein
MISKVLNCYGQRIHENKYGKAWKHLVEASQNGAQNFYTATRTADVVLLKKNFPFQRAEHAGYSK